jgi:hypothetical protein
MNQPTTNQRLVFVKPQEDMSYNEREDFEETL